MRPPHFQFWTPQIVSSALKEKKTAFVAWWIIPRYKSSWRITSQLLENKDRKFKLWRVHEVLCIDWGDARSDEEFGDPGIYLRCLCVPAHSMDPACWRKTLVTSRSIQSPAAGPIACPAPCSRQKPMKAARVDRVENAAHVCPCPMPSPCNDFLSRVKRISKQKNEKSISDKKVSTFRVVIVAACVLKKRIISQLFHFLGKICGTKASSQNFDSICEGGCVCKTKTTGEMSQYALW